MKKILIICMCLCMVLFGCNSSETKSEIATEAEKPDKLVVYISGVSHTIDSTQYYPTKYNVGTRTVAGEIECPRGNIFEQVLKDYTKETGIEIEVHYIEANYEAFAQKYEADSKMPDLIVMGNHHSYDYYRMAKQGILLDFTPYAEADEDLQDVDRYYQQVINGGKIDGRQYILPVLFNLNGLITSESYLDSMGNTENVENMSYEEVLDLLYRSCLTAKNLYTKDAIFESSGLRQFGLYIPNILLTAAYSQYYNEEVTEVKMDADIISSLMRLMNVYTEQAVIGIDNWEEMSYAELQEEKFSWKYMSLKCNDLVADSYEGVGIFLSGGGSGGLNYYNSLLTDAAYFSSMYEEENDEMVLCGIPTAENAGVYTANMTAIAAGFYDTEYPEAVYDLAKYFMSYEYPYYYGFSVDKELTQKQLEKAQNTTMEIQPDYMFVSVVGEFQTADELKDEIEYMNPLDERYITVIQEMLDHLDGAKMPDGYLESLLLFETTEKYRSGEMTAEEAASWLIESLQEQLKEKESLDPFERCDWWG